MILLALVDCVNQEKDDVEQFRKQFEAELYASFHNQVKNQIESIITLLHSVILVQHTGGDLGFDC